MYGTFEAIRLRKRLSQAQRKAAKLNNPGTEAFTVEQALALIDSLGSRCTYCGIECGIAELHLDHIVPLVRGGAHALRNITPACGACNISKKDRLVLSEWAPVILGGKPRWDKSAPRGQRGNPWNLSLWRDADGVLPAVMASIEQHPELKRVIGITEDFLATTPTSSLAAPVG